MSFSAGGYPAVMMANIFSRSYELMVNKCLIFRQVSHTFVPKKPRNL
jgi:hypothetical protein